MHLRLLLLSIALMAATPLIAQGAPGAVPVARMAADAHPSFAVATIKLHDPNVGIQQFNTSGDRVNIRNQTVASMLSFAYAIHSHQIVDAPDWIFHERYDVEGKTDTEGEPSLHQFQEMVQKLLGDRFQIKFHHDKRELSVYAIQLAKSGAKLKLTADRKADPDWKADGRGTEMTQTYRNASMSDFVLGMQSFLDRPLVDQTGLTSRYDFTLRYTYDEARATDPNAPPGLFTAIQEQLGLKLQPAKAPADVLVIDAVQKPSEN